MASVIKVVFIGDSGVGKTAIYQRLEKNTYSDEIQPTVGGGFSQVLIETPRENDTNIFSTGYDITDENKDHFIAGIWDTAGQERFRNIVPMYFQRSDIIILVYDITCDESFSSVEVWYEIIKQKAPADARIILIGNKQDLDKDGRTVSYSAGSEKAKALDATFLETSANESHRISC